MIKCWPWSHDYTPWKDTHSVELKRISTGKVVSTGIQQERRCQKCGILRMRIEFPKESWCAPPYIKL